MLQLKGKAKTETGFTLLSAMLHHTEHYTPNTIWNVQTCHLPQRWIKCWRRCDILHRTVKPESSLQLIMARAAHFCRYTLTSSDSSPNITRLITPLVKKKEVYWNWQTHLIRLWTPHTWSECYRWYHWANSSSCIHTLSGCVAMSLWWRAPKLFNISDHKSEQTLWCLLAFGWL